MGFWGRLGCLTGLHSWSDWSKPSGQCEQIRQCQRPECGGVDKRTDHTWSAWRCNEVNPCEELRECERCNLLSLRATHSWSRWQIETPTTCFQIRHCQRCADLERKEPIGIADHELRPEDLKRRRCREKSACCRRCGEEVCVPLTLPEHRWGPPRRRDGRQQVSCMTVE